MLHGKHVMVRVGGGWDTLQGFLLKYDPCRILQFATLEQKILAFQKGVSNESVPDSSARAPQPPEMNPLSAVSMFQKQYSKPGTPIGIPRSKEKQVRLPGVLPPASSLKGGNLACGSVRSKFPNSPAVSSHLKLRSSKGVTKKPEAPSNNASPSSASLNPVGKSTFSPALLTTAPCVSESLRKCISSPSTPKAKLIPAQKSRDVPESTLLPNKCSGKIEPKHLKHHHVSSRDYAVSHSAARLNSPSKCPKPPKANLHVRPNPSPSFQSPAKVTASSSKTITTGLRTQSQPRVGAPQAGAMPAQKLKSALNLNQPLSVSSVAPAKAAEKSKDNMVSVAKKQPQSKSTSQRTGPSSSRSPGRTPLSIVSLPQSSAKAQPEPKSAQTATKSQCLAKGPPKSGKAPAATRKPPSSGKEAVSGDKKPAKKKEDNDHYFVMTGSKKPRK